MNWQSFFDVSEATYYVSFHALAFLFEALILLWFGKLIFDRVCSYDLNKELTKNDNKAIAVAFTGYMIGQAIIILGVIQGPSTDFVGDLIGVALWSLLGIVLLNLAMWFNRSFLLHKFDTTKELVTDRNVGTGAVLCGTYIGTAFMVSAVVSSEGMEHTLISDLVAAGIFFLVGQLGFILFSHIYQQFTKFDIHHEIEKDNVAAGVGFGMTLIAVGILMSNTIHKTSSLVAFGVWFLNGVVLLVVTRFLVDKLILPNDKLDTEISEDHNWGAALIEGSTAIMVAFLLNAAFA